MVKILKSLSSSRTKNQNLALVPMIKKINFFAEREIPHENYTVLSQALQYEFGRRGEVVFEKGSIGDKFYIILRGSVGKSFD